MLRDQVFCCRPYRSGRWPRNSSVHEDWRRPNAKAAGVQRVREESRTLERQIAEHAEVDATAQQAESWNGEEIRSNVVRYVSASETPRELWGLGRALKSLSPRTNDALLSILSGSDYFTGASMLDVSRITNCEHVAAINDSPLQWS